MEFLYSTGKKGTLHFLIITYQPTVVLLLLCVLPNVAGKTADAIFGFFLFVMFLLFDRVNSFESLSSHCRFVFCNVLVWSHHAALVGLRLTADFLESNLSVLMLREISFVLSGLVVVGGRCVPVSSTFQG